MDNDRLYPGAAGGGIKGPNGQCDIPAHSYKSTGGEPIPDKSGITEPIDPQTMRERFLEVFDNDITEQKETGDFLRLVENRDRLLLRTAMDGFWLADTEGRLIEVNDTYCRMSGYSAKELLTMRISDLEALETHDDTAAHIQKIMSNSADRFESRHRRKDGSIFDVEVSVKYQPTHGGWMVAFMRDITELKKAREALKERVKELNCLYGISALMEYSDFTLKDVLKAAVQLIPPALRLPDIGEACITIGAYCFQTDGFKETPWMLSRGIKAKGKTIGKLAVCYLKEQRTFDGRVFLMEEDQLLSAIADNIGHFAERKQAEETMRLLSSRLLTSQEEEQRRIAMELHDQTGQDLNVLKLHLCSFRDRLREQKLSLCDELDRILGTVDGIIEDIRRLAHGLSPNQLEVLGLRAALTALIRNFSEKTGIPIRFDVDAVDMNFGREKQIILYRIFQEVLTNIYKHAGARTVQIDAHRQGEGLAISIVDDGCGFDISSYRASGSALDRGMGLSALELRAQMIGGELKILSQPGEGTKIDLLVQINGKLAVP